VKTPRPYQIKQVDEAASLLTKHKRIIIQSPTGTGKSFMMLMIIRRAIEKDKTVLVITESIKIFNQLVTEFSGIKIDSSVKKLTINSNFCYVAMSQSMINREHIITQFNALGDRLITIIDEAHVGVTTKLIKRIDNGYRIGFTATPAAKWAKHLPELYDEICTGLQVQEHIELGSLSPFKYFARVKKGIEALKIKNGEFTEESQDKAFGTKEVYDGLYEDLINIKFKKCVVFVASIKQCDETYDKLQSMGFECTKYHSKLDNPDHWLNRFTHGNAKIVVCVSALTKGWDYPPIDLILLVRATTSLPLVMQMWGRGSRLLKDKELFTIVDYGKNYERFGLYSFDRDWRELWLPPKKRKQGTGAAPVRCCPTCGFMMHASASQCPECKFVFPKATQTPKETALIEMTTQYNALRGRKMSSLTPQELAIYVKITNRKMFGQRIAKARGDAFLNAYAKQMGWTYGWWNYTVADETLEYADIEIK
jgi:superfamily II DNA or RNA helicase